jgi:STE24 endopeptidase
MTHVFQTQFFWWFLGFYLVYEIVLLVLDSLNYRHTKKNSEIPVFYRGLIMPSKFERSQQYTLEKLRFSITSRLGFVPFFWFLIFRNGFNIFDYYAAHMVGYGTLSHSVLFCVFFATYLGAVTLPFRIYSIFVIEDKYGFNKMSFGLFLVDLFKGIALASVIGIPLLYAIFWFMRASGALWWLYVWGLITGFQFFFTALYPAFLAPLFNKFQPLEDGELKERITMLAQKIGFQMSGVFVIDGSRRSGHSNAYFAGLGKYRRIVLFDTLIKQLSTDELVGVLAHEMGHNVKNHVRSFTILSSVLSLVALYILSRLINWPEFYQAFHVTMPSAHTALAIFSISADVFTFFLTPVMNFLSRHYEYQADAFAVASTGKCEPLKGALVKLTQENLSNLTPHPVYSFFHYSHPTTPERARAMDAVT